MKPIKTSKDYERAVKRLEILWDAPENSPEADEAEILATLIDVFEEEHFPMEDPDPIEAILFRLDQMDMTPKDLEPILGSRARVWEVLNKKRELTLPMIRALYINLGIPAEVLIASY